ncbi:isochorismatase-family hydrolase [Acaromyces ingoldii]|uniref:Isochorismatase-family hydrolase n=1 Tax=Acaromyces ingoldii TaxID=215250 RepID=A0A316YU75_9BASI|nr:isochorismatase-family hydrolase [Acaromyces ingoldii]PWN92987.1 isochorismatase-family hydrolase [Acaromyces ingoldii]
MATEGPEPLPALDPRKTAFVVMDIQPLVFARMPSPPTDLLPSITAMLAAARRTGCTVVIVRVAFSATDFAAIPPTNKAFGRLAERAGGSAEKLGVLESQPATQVLDEVKPLAGEIEVRKTRTGAFSTTDLHEQLKAKGIDTLILAGVSTSGAVLSTVRDATDKDYRIVVMRDGVADPKEEVHNILLDVVFEHSCYVAKSSEIIEKLG